MIGAKKHEAEKAKQEGVARVERWIVGLLPDDEKEEDDGGTAPDGKETNVIVNQLACKEPGCPDVEVVITLIRAKPRPKLMFKIYKAAAELTSEDVAAALKKAQDDEQPKPKPDDHAHGHDEHDHSEGHAGHGADCCDCGHDHGHGHSTEHDSHEHGHDDDESKKQKLENEHSHA